MYFRQLYLFQIQSNGPVQVTVFLQAKDYSMLEKYPKNLNQKYVPILEKGEKEWNYLFVCSTTLPFTTSSTSTTTTTAMKISCSYYCIHMVGGYCAPISLISS